MCAWVFIWVLWMVLHQNHAGSWTGNANMLPGVNKCVKVCIYGVLWWASVRPPSVPRIFTLTQTRMNELLKMNGWIDSVSELGRETVWMWDSMGVRRLREWWRYFWVMCVPENIFWNPDAQSYTTSHAHAQCPLPSHSSDCHVLSWLGHYSRVMQKKPFKVNWIFTEANESIEKWDYYEQ